MPEWLYEAGIGEARAALIDRGRIVELAIEPEDGGHRAGAVLPARLIRKVDARGRGRVALQGGQEADLQPVPPGLTEGAALMVEVVRQASPSRDDPKPPRVRAVDPATPPAPGLALRRRIALTGVVRDLRAGGDDLLEAHGWSEAIEQAESGIVASTDCLLRIVPTPAMTLIDVDGALPAAALARAGAEAAAAAIRRFGIVGSIGIDLPTMADRGERLAAAAAFDAVLPQPFERTAVNGFGFLQVIRRRTRPSLIDAIAADPAGHAARALLRRAERAHGQGALILAAHPQVIRLLGQRPAWIEELAARTATRVGLREDAGLAISGGHAQREHP